MTDNNYRLALDAIHVTPTSTTALTDATKLTGLKSFPVNIAATVEELKHLNGDNWSEYATTWHTGSSTIAGTCVTGSAVQQVLEDALMSGTPLFVHCIRNAAAASGQRKGTMYKMVLESGEFPQEAGAVCTFSYPVKISGAPVPILAV